MLANKYLKLLRAINLSKTEVTQSMKQPQLVQIVIKIKAEKSFDPINNLMLLLSLSSGGYPSMTLINSKKGIILPYTIMSKVNMFDFISLVLPELLTRTIDKITSISYGTLTNKVSFSFKATDAVNLSVRKIWKLFETEVGNYEFEVDFVTNSFDSFTNETLLRSLQIPVVIDK